MSGKIIPIAMPKWGIEMEEGQVSKWAKQEGDSVSPGELLIDIETDKLTNAYEAEYSGVLRRRIAKEGVTYPVGQLLGVVADQSVTDDAIDAFVKSYSGGKVLEGEEATSAPAADYGGQAYSAHSGTTPISPVADTPARVVDAQSVSAQIESLAQGISPIAGRIAVEERISLTGIASTGRLGRVSLEDLMHHAGRPVGRLERRRLMSPRARRIARERNIDLTSLTGSGAGGRLVAADVPVEGRSDSQGSPATQISQGSARIVRMSPMRKAIARSLTLSKSTIPHFYLRAQVRVDALLEMRERAKLATGQAPSINDYLVRACALALMDVPAVNIQVHDDEIHHFSHADIAVAVSTEKGLITPIVRAAETKSVAEISAEIKSLAERAKSGSLKAAEFQGGSFSVSNLGMFGIDQFDAIINPPQGAILAVGAARRIPVETKFALTFATVVELSLSCDHRAIDGAIGARFVGALRALIEEPNRLTQATSGPRADSISALR